MASEFSDLFQVKEKIRGPIVDGIFYPDDDHLLKEEIRYLLGEIEELPGKAFGIIAPHAALPFSGSLAAVAFKSAAKRVIDNVVIIASVHRDEKDAVFLTESESFTIPTGNIKVNRELVKKLRDQDRIFEYNDLPHLEEHCIEVQLPFIRFLYPEANIIPILLGSNSTALLRRTAAALENVFRDRIGNTLFVVSANMTGYLPPEEAHDYCDRLVEIVESGSAESIFSEIDKGVNKTKGIGSLAVLLSIAGGNARVKVLRKKDSSKYGCENSNIVCYAAISVEKTD